MTKWIDPQSKECPACGYGASGWDTQHSVSAVKRNGRIELFVQCQRCKYSWYHPAKAELA